MKEVAEKVKTLRQTPLNKVRGRQGKLLRLAAILVGGIGSSRKFLELKKKAAEKIGIECRIYEFPENITTQKLRKEVGNISRASVNHGIIVELPLPSRINSQYVLNSIPQEKDVDALSEKAQGAFFTGRSKVLPPAVEAVKIIFEKHDIEPKGKNCVIFGYGLLIGKPISHWLSQSGATVSVINEFTLNPAELSRQADIVISGVGKPNLIKADMIKKGAVVIDFGYSRAKTQNEVLGSPEHFVSQNVLGDVAFDEVNQKAGLITPVPGGVGPIVIATVLKNLIFLRKNCG